ncbi:MAG: ABC-F family ATP-binding cassette domain-containing protein [Lachnospiraceae bacterium]|nr:ABC-F family ATP-binding cassette domain-containing protein [Lachnospiraceae bacterium]
MNILNLENVSKTYMSKKVLSNVCIGIDDEDKIGVVGANGTGKSTILGITAGAIEADEGAVVKGAGIRISYLPQEPVFDENRTVLENVTAAIYAGEDHWDKMGEIKANLAKFGIDDPECSPAILSGGQKKRAALVGAIMTPADLLILDEPTNHLDSEMIEWLEEYLKRYRGAIFMVTHDRYFLDEVTNQIVEIDKGNAYRYTANYSGYLELKEQRMDYEQAAERKAAALYKKDLAWMLRGARARSTKQKAHIKRFEELKDRKKPEEERAMELSSLSVRMGNKTIILDGLTKKYGERILFSDFSYHFKKLDRIGIIGPNGCGKTTLLKCITGDVIPDRGTIEIGQTIEIGYFRQDNVAVGTGGEAAGKTIDENMRVIDYIKETAEYIHTKDGPVSASLMCERFLFDGNMQYAPISKLSGGERRRLFLLKVLMGAPNVIVLDEPTNDLDIATLRILEDYLDTFAGIVITVSHDRYFLDRVVTTIFSFEPDGSILRSEGGYSEYLEKRMESAIPADKPKAEKQTENRDAGRTREKKKLSFKEQYDYDHIEEEIETLEKRSEELERLMADASSDYSKLIELGKEKEEIDQEIEQKFERFMELQELVDKIG